MKIASGLKSCEQSVWFRLPDAKGCAEVCAAGDSPGSNHREAAVARVAQKSSATSRMPGEIVLCISA